MTDDVVVSDDLAGEGRAAQSGGPAESEQYPVGTMHPRTAVLLVSAFACLLIVAVLALLPVPYAVLAAGPAVNTLGSEKGKDLIEVIGKQTYPTSGELDLTTVRIFGGPGSRVNLWRVLYGWLDPSEAVLPEEDVFPPGRTAQQTQVENQQEMASSQEAATAAALTSLGYPVTTHVGISSFVPGAASASVLKAKDVILAVKGVAVANGDDLRAELQKVSPGSAVELTVRRDGRPTTLRPLTQQGAKGGTALGVQVAPVFDFPFQVKIQIEDVGGPSAGTMFALGIIDKLTPGAMTGGAKIAGTGTMDVDGSVGPIGGIRQKLVGARDQGASYFLAPRDNCAEVVGHVPDGLSVVSVATLAQARAAVEQIGTGKGTAGLPTCS